MEDDKVFAVMDAQALAMLQTILNCPDNGGVADSSKTASVKFMITNKDECDLRNLGYSQEFIDRITPHEAAKLIQSGTKAVVRFDPV